MVLYNTNSFVSESVNKLAGVSKADKYFNVWLWFCCRTLSLVDARLSSNDCLIELIRLWKEDKIQNNLAELYRQESRSGDDFLWILRDKRQRRWLINYINEDLVLRTSNVVCQDSNNIYVHKELKVIVSLNGVDDEIKIRLYCDFVDADMQKRADFLKKLTQGWLDVKRRDEYLRWFSGPGGKAKRHELFEWGCKNNHIPHQWNRPLDIHLDVLDFFDVIRCDIDYVATCVGNIKNNYNQKRFRKNIKGKVQKNFLLSSSTVNSLDALKEKYGISHSQIIETLVRKEQERGVYIAEELDRIKALDCANNSPLITNRM